MAAVTGITRRERDAVIKLLTKKKPTAAQFQRQQVESGAARPLLRGGAFRKKGRGISNKSTFE